MTYRDPIPEPVCPICETVLEDDAIKEGNTWFCHACGLLTPLERVRAQLDRGRRNREQGASE